MKKSDAFGKILSLTKRIHLQKPSQPAGNCKFFMGPRKRVGTFATEWWTTWDTKFTCEDLAIALMQGNPQLTDGDVDAFGEEIMDVLKEAVADASLFDSWMVLTRRVPTLFDAIAEPDRLVFAKKIFARFEAACFNCVCDWVVIYPFHRTHAQTVSLKFDGLHLLGANDACMWSIFHKHYPATAYFNVQSGGWVAGFDGSDITMKRQVPTWVICEVRGSADGARRRASRRIKTLVALVLSIVGEVNRGVLMKTMWETSSCSIQFAGSGRGGCVTAGIGHLLPSIGDDLKISSTVIDEIGAWHQALSLASPDVARRATTASQYLHQALLESETEQFLHFFITLDALFGERWKVESGIIRGVRSVFPADESWADRCRRLFDLRSELVHGEISSISEWQELSRYRRHFRSEPLRDAELFAMKALRHFFQLPSPLPPGLSYEI